jgi:hypothetical protein
MGDIMSGILSNLRTRRVRTAYRAILRREPSSAELLGVAARTVRGGRYFQLLRDMVDSEEFSLQILPGLVVTQTALRAPTPVFFMHIPKTGGTSIRVAIAQAMGVPAMNIYAAWPTPDRATHGYWPYWAGHAHAEFFPGQHVGITLLREPRSRMLSLYRQIEHNGRARRTHGWDLRRPEQSSRVAMPPFSSWLAQRHRSGTASTLHYFMPSDDPMLLPMERDHGHDFTGLLSLSDEELRAGVRRTMRRFGAVAWIHDETGVLEAIRTVTGSLLAELPRENTFDGKQRDVARLTVTPDDRRLLEESARLDQLVVDVAEECGHVKRLQPDEADAMFELTATRLGFVL